MPRKKFPGGKICNVSTSTTRNTQAHVNKTHSDIDIELANLFDAEFGRIFDPGKVLDASIAEKKNTQREHRAKLKAIKRLKAKDRPTPYSKIKQGLEQKLERATIDLENLQKQKRDIKKRQKIAQNIVDLFSERLH